MVDHQLKMTFLGPRKQAIETPFIILELLLILA